MTRQDAIKLLALIKVAYPSSFKDMDKESKLATVAMWQTSFPDVPYIIMEMAFNNFRMVSKFAPTVADMCDELKHLYYMALEEQLNMFGGNDTHKMATYIANNTKRFQYDSQLHINYGSISRDLIESPGNKQLLEGGDT